MRNRYTVVGYKVVIAFTLRRRSIMRPILFYGAIAGYLLGKDTNSNV